MSIGIQNRKCGQVDMVYAVGEKRGGSKKKKGRKRNKGYEWKEARQGLLYGMPRFPSA